MLEKAGMTVNKNTIPYVNSPMETSNRPHPILKAFSSNIKGTAWLVSPTAFDFGLYALLLDRVEHIATVGSNGLHFLLVHSATG